MCWYAIFVQYVLSTLATESPLFPQPWIFSWLQTKKTLTGLETNGQLELEAPKFYFCNFLGALLCGTFVLHFWDTILKGAFEYQYKYLRGHLEHLDHIEPEQLDGCLVLFVTLQFFLFDCQTDPIRINEDQSYKHNTPGDNYTADIIIDTNNAG